MPVRKLNQYVPVRDHVAAHADHAAASLGRTSFAFLRRCANSMSCSGMPTGHASQHAPHRLDAFASSLAVSCSWCASKRGEHRAHRPRVHPPVCVPTNLAVDGAHVEARAAPNAVEHLGELTGRNVAAAVVDYHEMEFVGTVRLAVTARSGHGGHVGGHGLARRTPRQQRQHHVELIPVRHHALHAHQRDVYRRHAARQADRCLRW